MTTPTPTSQGPEKSPILVIGMGVIGLTTSVRLLQASHKVHIIATQIPTSPLDPTYCSSAAGAHHLSFAADNDERQRRLDMRTFEVMMKEEADEGEASAILRLTQREFYGTEGERHIEFFEGLPDFRVVRKEDLPDFAKHAVSFTSLTMDTTPYLHKLFALFTSLGGTYTHLNAPLPSLSSALTHLPPSSPAPLAIINCTGIGSLTLGDVEDKKIYPVRGQVIALDAPWIKEGRTLQVGKLGDASGEGGKRTYIIPRKSGQVIIGGTMESDDWCRDPRPETAEDIKRRALMLCPELCPPHLRPSTFSPSPSATQSLNPSLLDSIILKHVVGFRPAREGGLRLERGDDLVTKLPSSEARIPVVHNYGHAGAGWQCSWGCAEEVVRIVQEL